MIQRVAVQPVELGLVPELPPLAPKAESAGKFPDLLDRFLNDVDDLQKRSDETQKGAMEGTVQDIHQVMLAADEAGIAFELLVELRNKLLDTYHELMRMQI
jgi:flagellar hook-basal body complex protein FliE